MRGFLLIIFLVSGAFSQSAWEQVRGQYADLKSVIYTNGQFVAVGDSGTIITSQDGQKWKKNSIQWDLACRDTFPISQICFNSVAYGNRNYMAVGSGTKAILPDTIGRPWSVDETTSPSLLSILFDGQKFVALCSNPKRYSTDISISQNGITWSSPISLNLDNNQRATSVEYVNGKYFVVGGNLSLPAYKYSMLFLTSVNCTTWTNSKEVPYSPSVRPNCMSVAQGNNKTIGVGWGTIFSTPDNFEWTLDTSDTNIKKSALFSVIYDNNQFIAVGAVYYEAADQTDLIVASADGLQWSVMESSIKTPLRSVAYGNNLFVAVGDGGTILISKADIAAVSPSNKKILPIVKGHQNLLPVDLKGRVMNSEKLAEGVYLKNKRQKFK